MLNKVEKDCWATPQYLFNWANDIYKFDIDLCASRDNAKCGIYYEIRDNSLERDWYGDPFRVGWCNPPYSDINPWVEKAIEQAKKGFTTVMLIPSFNGEKRDSLIFDNATNIVLIEGRIGFINPVTGKKVSGNPKGSMIVEFSKNNMGTGNPNFMIAKRNILEEMYK